MKKLTAKVKKALIQRVGDEQEDFDLVIADLGIEEDRATEILEDAGFEKCAVCGTWSDGLNSDGECADCETTYDDGGENEDEEAEEDGYTDDEGRPLGTED
jgi:rubrerythrin